MKRAVFLIITALTALTLLGCGASASEQERVRTQLEAKYNITITNTDRAPDGIRSDYHFAYTTGDGNHCEGSSYSSNHYQTLDPSSVHCVDSSGRRLPDEAR
jgi:hypothetical protein